MVPQDRGRTNRTLLATGLCSGHFGSNAQTIQSPGRDWWPTNLQARPRAFRLLYVDVVFRRLFIVDVKSSAYGSVAREDSLCVSQKRKESRAKQKRFPISVVKVIP